MLLSWRIWSTATFFLVVWGFSTGITAEMTTGDFWSIAFSRYGLAIAVGSLLVALLLTKYFAHLSAGDAGSSQ